MRAGLNQTSAIEHYDKIDHVDCRERIGDRDGDPTLALAGSACRRGLALEQGVFHFRIEGDG